MPPARRASDSPPANGRGHTITLLAVALGLPFLGWRLTLLFSGAAAFPFVLALLPLACVALLSIRHGWKWGTAAALLFVAVDVAVMVAATVENGIDFYLMAFYMAALLLVSMSAAYISDLRSQLAAAIAARKASEAKLLDQQQPGDPTDPLTRLFTREAFYTQAERSLSLHVRHERQLSVCVVEIDRYRALMDERGREVGDEIVRQASARVLTTIRTEDCAAHTEPGKIVILLPETGIEGARALVARLRAQIDEAPFRHSGVTLRVSASFGAAELGDHENVHKLIGQAEEDLYEARRNWRLPVR